MSDRKVPSMLTSSIADLQVALDTGTTTAVDLAAECVNRIAAYDRHGPQLNAVPVLNPQLFIDVWESDERRRQGLTRGPLDGIPYTVKDSYAAKGLTVAAGSPAFHNLTASEDSFAVEQLREAGAILIGRTNMPPMAAGGMQRGYYGRAESPFSDAYLTSAFASGSSNGSGTATAAGFAAFGLGEETWSSGRAPASLNSLVAYTPSRGVISMRGNWHLIPTMDVVVPHTRSVKDLLLLLDVLVVEDPQAGGDFWRLQPWVELPPISQVRSGGFSGLEAPLSLEGRRFGVPRMYINADLETCRPIATADSVMRRWEATRDLLVRLGAEVVEVDFPAVSNYEEDRPGAQNMVARGLVPEEFVSRELWDLVVWAWDTFLKRNNDPNLNSLAQVEGELIFPPPEGALPDRYHSFTAAPTYPEHAKYVTFARQNVPRLEEIPTLKEGIEGLERTRQIDFEDWLESERLDAIVFPALANVAPADADTNPASAEAAWQNGTWVANGNLVPRHLGIPTVTEPMGRMEDTRMPVGLTFAGRAYDDKALLEYALALERVSEPRVLPERTPELSDANAWDAKEESRLEASNAPQSVQIAVKARVVGTDTAGATNIHITGTVTPGALICMRVNGEACAVSHIGNEFSARASVPPDKRAELHSAWRGPYGIMVVAQAHLRGASAADYAVVDGVA